MVRFFLKRLVGDANFFIKFLFITVCFFMYTYTTIQENQYVDRHILDFQSGVFNGAKEWEKILDKGDYSTMSSTEIENSQLLKKLSQSRIAYYYSLQNNQYIDFIKNKLEADRTELELYQKKYMSVPPNYAVSNEIEFAKLVALEEAYYKDMVKQGNLKRNDALQITANGTFLESVNYWNPKSSNAIILTSLVFFIPILFSSGIISGDKKKVLFFRRLPSTNQAYMISLFVASFIQTVIIQLLELLIYFVSLCIAFGGGNLTANVTVIIHQQATKIPMLGFYILYIGMLLLIDIALIGVLLLGELLFSRVASLVLSVAFLFLESIVKILHIDLAWKQFFFAYYLDSVRAMTGWKELEYKAHFSVENGFASLAGLCLFLLGMLACILYIKDRRGQYV